MEPNIVALAKLPLLVMATLLPVMNPPGVAPIYLAMTAGAPDKVHMALVRSIGVNLFVLLVAAMFVGSHILAFFSISLPVVRIAGAIVVIGNAWDLLRSEEPGARADNHLASAADWGRERIAGLAFYPIVFPLTAGPGTISITITLGAGLSHHGVPAFEAMVAEIIGLAAVSAVTYFCYRFASKLLRLLGRTGTTVLLRLSSFILLCVGVQIFWDASSELILPWLAAHN